MRAWLRLSLVFSVAGLLASRIGLLVHEFIGHGGMAYALGGSVPEWRLFLFGGGWIRYNRDPWYSTAQELCIILAGVGSELVFASLLWAVSTRLKHLPRAMTRIAAMLLCAHACVYIATGTHYGLGDGMKLHLLLSSTWRHVIVLGLSILMTVMAYGLAKQGLLVAGLLEVGRGWRRVLKTGLAVAVAAMVHGSLTYGERLVIDPDQTYEAMMLREVERRAAKHMVSLEAQNKLAGVAWSPEDAAAARARYVEKHEPWPLRPLLVLLGGLASMLACWRFHRSESEKLVAWRSRMIRGPSLALVLVMLAIVIVDALG